eukprot:TRINITY_DN81982_c0_g1_i1.p1 TRINITY_DN81982_c0_g1~~TRINITY_DN81982_c0_g1_i1.p1  ORF type:complete len:617 (-),score=56.81 TRINITY_DN81982_c0_g1_i1:356-2116(-)
MAMKQLLLWLVPLVWALDPVADNSTSTLVRPQRPHIIMLVLDDIGWADVGAHGSNFPTPNIDGFIKQGVELQRMYAMPQCSPTRSSIMTGRWAWTIGMQHWTTLQPGSGAGIPANVPTLAEVMKTAGYDTHAIGKWHLGYSSWSQTPVGRGFDTHLGYLQGQVDYYNRSVPSCGPTVCFYRSNCASGFEKDLPPTCEDPVPAPYGGQAAALDFWKNKEPLPPQGTPKHTTHLYMERFEELLQPYRDERPKPDTKPLFVYFAQQLLHIPLELPDEPRHLEACRNVKGGEGIINRTVLCAMASRLDETVAQMVQLLKEYKLYNDTLIWAYSDNGGMTQFTDAWPASASSNWPLRGSKSTLFEGGIRSVSWLFGGALPASVQGTRNHDLLHAVDILPTLAGLAGVASSELPHTLSGTDAWGSILGSKEHRVRRTELPINVACNRDLSPTAIPNYHTHDPFGANYSAIINWPWKLILGTPYRFGQLDKYQRGGWWSIDDYKYTAPEGDIGSQNLFLFNLETDEAERHNVASQFPEIVSNMTKRVQEFWLSNEESGYVPPQVNVPRPRSNPRPHNWTWSPFWHLEDEITYV